VVTVVQSSMDVQGLMRDGSVLWTGGVGAQVIALMQYGRLVCSLHWMVRGEVQVQWLVEVASPVNPWEVTQTHLLSTQSAKL